MPGVNPPSYANKQLVRKAIQTAQKKGASLPGAALKKAEQKALSSALKTAAHKAVHPLWPEKNKRLAAMRPSVLPLRENIQSMYPEALLTASSFVIEETFNGKKQLWGVTAAHVANQLSVRPGIVTQKGIIPIQVAIQGSPDMTDIALFPIPGELAPYVHPLTLAKQSPAAGTVTHSFGYFHNGFHLVSNRRVLESTPSRLITSLEFKTKDRGGACGGPLLNEQNQVVGVHIGSSSSKKISYAVPVEHIYKLLAAYHNRGKFMQPLLFKGKKLGEINVNEALVAVQARYRGRTTVNMFTQHQENLINYSHLETLLPPGPIDELYLYIESSPTKPEASPQRHIDLLFWSLRSGRITRERQL